MKSTPATENPVGGFRLRLTIAIPCLLVLITGICGQVSKSILEHAALQLDEKGGAEVVEQALIGIEVMISVGVLISAVMGVALSRIVTTPFRRISQHFDTLAREGRVSSLDASMGNEIGSLYASFNRLVTSIERVLPEQSRYLFHSVATGVFAVNHEGILTNINAAADKTLELGGVGINGQHYESFFARFGDMQELVTVIRDTLEKGLVSSGKEIRVSTISGVKKNLVICTSLSPERFDGTCGTVATVMDLGVLNAVNARMQHEDKLSSLGRLASGVAHEIRNPLASIRGLAQLLREGIPEDNESGRKYTAIILEEVDRLNGVVGQLLDFSRPSDDERAVVSIPDLLTKAVDLVNPRIRGRRLHLMVEMEDGLPDCRVVPDKIMQVFINLLINAVEATPDEGRIHVSVRRVVEGIQTAVFNSGSYITPEVLAHLFEPFYTTKDTGSGLGLALSYQIMRAHKGSLVAKTDPKEGTTFLCTMPLAEAGLPNHAPLQAGVQATKPASERVAV